MHTSHASRWQSATAALGLTLLGASAAHADDTEIFMSQANTLGVQPNILLIFDTSGSMADPIDLDKAPYDPQLTYSGSCAANSLYWRRGPGAPPACNSTQRIPVTANACAASSTGLSGSDAPGLWSGRLAQWNAGQKRWSPLDSRFTGQVECRNDAGMHGNANAAVWAADGDPGPWSGTRNDEINWSSVSTYTLYTSNWLNWLYAPDDPVTVSRQVAAFAAAKTLAYSIDGVNLGLMRFSSNAEGGMVTNPVQDMSVLVVHDDDEEDEEPPVIIPHREKLVRDLERFFPENTTPLTETLYEAGQYFAGRTVEYGDTSTGNFGATSPSVEKSRISGNRELYDSPIDFQCQRNFIILLTDGAPTEDNGAEPAIAQLPGFAAINPGGCAGSGQGRCLDEMARYLRNRDLAPQDPLPGLQNVVTYTVGFGPEVQGSTLLQSTALAGGGEAFSASDVVDLTNALQQIVADIGQRSATFTTASVAVNAFNRTQTSNEVFISVFQPTDTERWPGNLKKYSILNGTVVDAAQRAAVDPGTGFFVDTAQSIWTAGQPDGNRVEAGGAASKLPAPTPRKMYTHLPGAAQPSADLTAGVNAVSTTNAQLSDAVLGTSTAEPARTQVIDWIRGVDVRDMNGNGNLTEANRFMGDPLHARPALVTYGPDADDSIVFLPTNDGLLHAVQGDTGVELWSFIPQELLPRLKDLYRDNGIVARSYGLDGEVRVLRFDVNQDNVIDPVAGDRVFIYFGMRRGGRSYYALDVSNPQLPRMLWQIGANASGARALPGVGETWSPPAIARVRIGGTTHGQNNERFVLIFGGGYDPAQEDAAFRADTSGNRIYMVDAVSGNLLWYAGGPGSTGTPNLPLAKMTHSIPARVSVLDLDGNGFADRMYAADLGGRVWRFDIWLDKPVGELVTGGVFADLGAASESVPTIENTRRFYNGPDVALIQRRFGEAYLNIALGSGYRGHPLHTATRDRFYSLRDLQPFTRLIQTDYDRATALTDGVLTDKTPDILGRIPFDSKGWKLELSLNGGWVGEKVLAEATTINGTILFPTYQPRPPESAAPCAPGIGINRAYALSVETGRPTIDFNDNMQITQADAFTTLAQAGIAGEISYVLDTSAVPPNDPNQGRIPRDSLGRRGLCVVGVEVMRSCVSPGNVVRTFWQRPTTN
jgi:type IV pilus assembly protein PilY1